MRRIFLRKIGDRITGEEVSLVVEALVPADIEKGYVPSYVFGVVKNDSKDRVGRISLRIGSNDLTDRYAGNIGYAIDIRHRGNGYAEKGCRLLADLAREHEIPVLYITCNPENFASKRTIEKLGARLLGLEYIPKNTDMYRRGDRIKLRYAWEI